MDSSIVPVTPITDAAPIDNNEPTSSEVQPNKRRRKKSIVWEHFTVETVGAGCTRACCKQCKKSFAYITGSKLAGTSHLKRHIALGICPVSRQKNQQTPFTPGSKSANGTDQPKRRYRASPGFASTSLDQDRCNHEIAKMIILHEYPLHIVEHPGFIDFVRTLQPQFNMASFNTIQGDCVAMYLREKQNLIHRIYEIPGRVSLTLDLWTSNETAGYIFLTGHFIDGDWNLHHRILSVVMVPSPDSDDAFNQAVVACLTDWHLESKLFTLTLDQSFTNETVIGNLRGFLSVKNPLMLNGQLLIGNCYARSVSCLVQDALGMMGQTIKKIRESVKYVKTSDAREEKFIELRQQLQVPSTKDLFIDDQTKWNTTYHMLVAACELKEVFSCLETADPDYRIAPSMDDWRQVEILCIYLKFFFDAVNILTAPSYPTANAFYHEVSKIQLELTHATMSQDPFISNLTKPLKEKFDKYWNSVCLVLAAAVVMDPRFKMKLIEFSFPKIYGEDAGTWIKIVDDGLHELFLDYVVQSLPLHDAYVVEANEDIPKTEAYVVEAIEGIPKTEAYVEDGNEGIPKTEAYVEEGNEGIPKTEVTEVYMEEGNEGIPKTEAHVEKGNESIPKTEAYMEEDNEGIPKTETSLEGPPQEGHHHEGFPQEGHRHEGFPQEGHHQEGFPQEGHHQEGFPQEGNHHEGFPQDGHHHEGFPQDGHHQEGFHQDGHHQEVSSQEFPFISLVDGLSDFEVYISEISSSQQMKSELDQYLDESLLPRMQEFDILGWWKLNKLKYPTLSKMASDILSIPVCTVAPDSVFNTESKKIDSYRSSLRPVTLEALICAKDWLQYGSSSSSSSSSEVPNAIVKMEF